MNRAAIMRLRKVQKEIKNGRASSPTTQAAMRDAVLLLIHLELDCLESEDCDEWMGDREHLWRDD